MLRLILYISCSVPQSAISPRTPVSSIICRSVLKSKCWVLGMTVASGVSLFLDFLSRQSKKIHVYINHVYTIAIPINLNDIYIYIKHNTTYVMVKMRSYLHLQPESISTEIILAFSSCLSITSHSNNKKCGSYHLSYTYLIVQLQ